MPYAIARAGSKCQSVRSWVSLLFWYPLILKQEAARERGFLSFMNSGTDLNREPARCRDVKPVGMTSMLRSRHIEAVLFQATIHFIHFFCRFDEEANMKRAGIFSRCSFSGFHQGEHKTPSILLIGQEAHALIAAHISHPEILDQEVTCRPNVGDRQIDMVEFHPSSCT